MTTIHCQNCGKEYQPGAARFCAKCGVSLPSHPTLLDELKSQPPAMNGFVRFVGGLSVFISIILLFLFTIWATNIYQTYAKVEETGQESRINVSGGFNFLPVMDNRVEVLQVALLIFSIGFLLSLVFLVLGEGIILVAQVREEHSRTLRLLQRMAILLVEKP